MKDKQAFIDAMDIQQDENGHWFVNGHIKGNVGGSVWGSVKRSVFDSVYGSVYGKINGREWKFVEENNNDA